MTRGLPTLLTSIALVFLVAQVRAATPECSVGVANCCSADVQCDDGDACNGVETCEVATGTCLPGTPVACADTDPCTADSCDPATGACANTPVPDDTPCDDGNACTTGEVCVGGLCGGGVPTDCDDHDACTADACDPTAGCTHTALSGCVPCVDVTPCDDGNVCTTDTCEAGRCQHVDNTDPCDDGDACTQVDTCAAGVCVGAQPVVCTAPDQCHAAGVCDPATGVCSNPAQPDATPCDDGDPCTTGETCQGGTCGGGAGCDDQNPCTVDACVPLVGCTHTAIPLCQTCVTAAQCDDQNPCTTDTCDAGRCQHADNTVTCDDGNACTQVDVCQAGVCVGTTPVACTALDQCHTAGACDPATGTCSNPARADNTPCNDGSACTQTDTCQNGACVGASPVVCTAQDQCHTAGTCDPGTGTCSNPARPDNTPCNDGSACTQTDTCQSGTCVGASPVVCTAQDQCHTAGTCDPTTGACSNPARADNTPCNDGSACTQADTCQSGACVGASPVVCTAQDQCHTAGTCDPATGTCSNPARPDSTPCDDGNACTQTDTCQSGACVGSAPVVCPTPDQCHSAGICNPSTGVCSNPARADNAPCNDGNACTQTDTCQSGTCVGASPVVCTAQDQCHTAGTCDPTTGACSNPARPDSTPCDDGNACTQTDTCQSGACVGSAPVVCPTPDQCHSAGICNPSTGVCSNPPRPDDTPCDDRNACTNGDVCRAGVCAPGPPLDCDDQNACTADACSPAGGCTHTATPGCVPCTTVAQCNDQNPCTTDACVAGQCQHTNNTAGCDDGNACTQADVCRDGACAGTQPVVCPTPDQCHTAGACDPSTGTCSNPARTNDAPCDDGSACTVGDTCQAGVCTPGPAPDCDDHDACTTDACAPATGCTHVAVSGCTPCSTATQCDDRNPCTTDTCVAGRCQYAFNTAPCDDGNACTKVDACQNGVCIGGSPVACSALDQCHVAGTCAPATGVCSNPAAPDDTGCDDGSACTLDDRCRAGACVGGAPPSCDDQNACTTDRCDPPSGCAHATVAGCRPCTAAAQCEDGNPCTTDTCDAGRCTRIDNTAVCDDDNACTLVDTCHAGTCVGAQPVVCRPLDACHQAGVCDPGTGTCSQPNAPDDTACDDGDACTEHDVCHGGACDGTPLHCDDGVACTDDLCVAGACEFQPRNARCDHGECALGVCKPDDAGADASGCIRTPVSEGEACTDDGFGCTEDLCTDGRCVHHLRDARCPPAGECGTTGCDPTGPSPDANGCVSIPTQKNGRECTEDGDPCTDDRCRDGACAHDALANHDTCDPVKPAFDQARQLAVDARAIIPLVDQLIPPAQQTPADGGPSLGGRLDGVAGTLDDAARALAGKPVGQGAGAVTLADAVVPRGLPPSESQERARIAFTQVLKTPGAVQGFLQRLATAQARAGLAPKATRDVRRRGRTLLRGTKALKRQLKRLQRSSGSFVH